MGKKIIVALILLSFIGVSKSYAQFRYGPSVGADITTLKFKQDLFTVDKSAGFSAGIVGELMFPGVGFGIDIGLLYEQRGATLHLSERELWQWQGYGNPRSYLHYVNLPIHLRFKWTRLGGFEEKAAPFLYVGPSFGFLAAHNKIDAMEYAGGELGLDFGIGGEFFQHWQLSGGYNIGMTYAMKAKILTDMSAKNRTWHVRIAYLF